MDRLSFACRCLMARHELQQARSSSADWRRTFRALMPGLRLLRPSGLGALCALPWAALSSMERPELSTVVTELTRPRRPSSAVRDAHSAAVVKSSSALSDITAGAQNMLFTKQSCCTGPLGVHCPRLSWEVKPSGFSMLVDSTRACTGGRMTVRSLKLMLCARQTTLTLQSMGAGPPGLGCSNLGAAIDACWHEHTAPATKLNTFQRQRKSIR